MIYAIIGLTSAFLTYYVWVYVIIYHFSKMLAWIGIEAAEWLFLKAYERIVIIPRC